MKIDIPDKLINEYKRLSLLRHELRAAAHRTRTDDAHTAHNRCSAEVAILRTRIALAVDEQLGLKWEVRRYRRLAEVTREDVEPAHTAMLHGVSLYQGDLARLGILRTYRFTSNVQVQNLAAQIDFAQSCAKQQNAVMTMNGRNCSNK